MSTSLRIRLLGSGSLALAALGIWAAALAGGPNPTNAPVAMRITITDPGSDDQADAKWKTRSNGDGTIRAKLEVEVDQVIEGRQYILRVSVLDLTTGEQGTVETPPLVAQPPR